MVCINENGSVAAGIEEAYRAQVEWTQNIEFALNYCEENSNDERMLNCVRKASKIIDNLQFAQSLFAIKMCKELGLPSAPIDEINREVGTLSQNSRNAESMTLSSDPSAASKDENMKLRARVKKSEDLIDSAQQWMEDTENKNTEHKRQCNALTAQLQEEKEKILQLAASIGTSGQGGRSSRSRTRRVQAKATSVLAVTSRSRRLASVHDFLNGLKAKANAQLTTEHYFVCGNVPILTAAAANFVQNIRDMSQLSFDFVNLTRAISMNQDLSGYVVQHDTECQQAAAIDFDASYGKIAAHALT